MTEQAVEKQARVPKAFGEWYIIRVAMPSGQTESGKVHLSDNAKDTQLWYGLVVSSPLSFTLENENDGVAVFFNRSAAIEKVPMIDEAGVPISFPYVAVNKGSIMAMWIVDAAEKERFLSPPATPPDHAWAKQMQRRVDLSL